MTIWASQVVLVVKNLPANAGDIRDMDSTPGLGRSPGGGHGNPLQCSCLEKPMNKGAWWAQNAAIIPFSSDYGEGNGHPHQYSCLENPMDRGAW